MELPSSLKHSLIMSKKRSTLSARDHLKKLEAKATQIAYTSHRL
jgi:hypothetical protein